VGIINACADCRESTSGCCAKHLNYAPLVVDIRDGMGNRIPLRQGPDEPKPTAGDWMTWAAVQRYLREHPSCSRPGLYDPGILARTG